MIPIALLLGLMVGRAWIVPVTAVAWVLLLLAGGTLGAEDVPFAAALSAANACVGVLMHRGVLSIRRRVLIAQ